MNSVIFKVVLKGNGNSEESSNKLLTLTFKNVLDKDIIRVPSHYISSLKSMSENRSNIISFQNLEEVITIGDFSKEYSLNYFIVVLFVLKTEEKKKGFLIANIKKIGDVLIGIWPFNEDIKDLDEDKIDEKFKDFIKNHDKYSSILIINPI
jgi:hypothetical protein